MKKTYSKPDIQFESFSLCSSIASCAIPSYTPFQRTCGFKFDSFIIFTADVQGCSENGGVVIEDGAIDGICYHNPSDLNNLFNS